MMRQLNIHMTPALARDLTKFMKIRHIKTKAEAVRTAVKESLEHSSDRVEPIDFSTWIGIGTQIPTRKKPKFKTDKDLWE